jgi:hypothetical protein
MMSTFWSKALAIAFSLACIGALGSIGPRWARAGNTARRVRVIAATRLGLLLFAQLLALGQLLAWADAAGRSEPGAVSGLSGPIREWLWVGSAALTVPAILNTIAGLWSVSPLVAAGPGATVLAWGQPGRIVAYGLAHLALETEAGWNAQLLYLTLAVRPLLLSQRRPPRGAQFDFEDRAWTEERIECLRQAAILAPYRDLSSPVTLSREANIVSLRVALTRPNAGALVHRLLDAALAAHDASASQPVPSER